MKNTQKNKKRSVIYFVRNGFDGEIKIGVTTNLKKRLETIQIYCPNEAVLLATLNGDSKKERELHALFSDFRKRGEWFFPSNKLLNYIRTYANITSEHLFYND